MTPRSTGRCRAILGNGLSAVLIASAALTSAMTGCATTEHVSPPPSTSQPSIPGPDAASTTAGTVDAPAPLRPTRVVIPAIGVEADVVDVGLDQAGALQVPPSAFPTGWYSGSPVPGEIGPSIITGHVDWKGDLGVFHRLHDLVPGDEITTVRSDGSTPVFRVTAVEQYAKSAFPTAAVYGDIDHPGLRLITCSGEFDSTVRSYRDNTVVYADLVELRQPALAQHE